jgi:putative N6-adenine-specific DNA methylase
LCLKVFNLLDTYFAVTSPGLEPFAADELRRLGLDPLPQPGGVTFKGTLPDLYRANLHLRTASRILARLGNFFRAETFAELQQRSARLPWERFLLPGRPVSLRVTCHKSRLYHSDAVARTVGLAISACLGEPAPLAGPAGEAGLSPQLILVRLAEDRCTISVDSSGDLLHKRGYRQAVARAPLRETLAAAVLLACGWDRASPLLDPFCGSGTLPIEAALLARGLPPGLHRRFAFMDWPGFDPVVWGSLLPPPQKPPRPLPPLLASDRDAGAVEMARANAERAGVADCIRFERLAVSAITPPAGPGWVVTNPPYGQRVSPGKDLRDLYARFGDVLRRHCPGWSLAVLCSDPLLLGQLGLDLDASLRFTNGGLPVRLARGRVA